MTFIWMTFLPRCTTMYNQITTINSENFSHSNLGSIVVISFEFAKNSPPRKDSPPLSHSFIPFPPLLSNSSDVQLSDNQTMQDIAHVQPNFQQRFGDWICIVCKNLNFSWRNICNLCKSDKEIFNSILKAQIVWIHLFMVNLIEDILSYL